MQQKEKKDKLEQIYNKISKITSQYVDKRNAPYKGDTSFGSIVNESIKHSIYGWFHKHYQMFKIDQESQDNPEYTGKNQQQNL